MRGQGGVEELRRGLCSKMNKQCLNVLSGSTSAYIYAAFILYSSNFPLMFICM